MTSQSKDRAEALLQVDEHLRNKFRINLVSLAGPGHEKESNFLERVVTNNTDGWTSTGDPTHGEKTCERTQAWWRQGCSHAWLQGHEKTEMLRSLAGRLLYHSLDDPRVQFETGLVICEG